MPPRTNLRDQEGYRVAVMSLPQSRLLLKAGRACYLWFVLVFGMVSVSRDAYSATVSPSLAREVLPYAKLCENVYEIGKNPSAPAPDGWKVVDDSSSNSDAERFKSVGFHAAVYANIESGEKVLVFEGTDGLSDKDWSHNLAAIGAQFNSAFRYFEGLLAKYSDLSKAAGHSLGGGLAQVVAASTGLNAYTFNTPGVTMSMRVSVAYASTGDRGVVDKFETELKFKFSQMAVALYAIEGPKIAAEAAGSVMTIGSEIKEARQTYRAGKGGSLPEGKVVNIVASLDPVHPLSVLFLGGLDYGSDFLIDLGLISPLSAHSISQVIQGLEKLSPPGNQVKKPVAPARGATDVNIDGDYFRPPNNTFPIGQCTWFVYGRMKELRLTGLVNVLDSKGAGRDAKNWLGWAKQAGLLTGVEPRQNSIACWTTLGHVAFVEEATPDGQPRVTESNVPIPKTLRVIAMQMTDGKQKPMLLFLNKDEAQEVGEVPIGQMRSIKSLGDLSSGREGLCQVAAAQEDFDARAGQLNMPSEKYIASSEGKRFAPWARRYWTSAAFEGNFTGIRLSPDAPAYGLPDQYIYLDTAAPTGPTVATVAGSVVLKLRSDVSMTQPVVASVAEGTTMQVVQGPVQSGEFVWWKLTGKPGEGWAAVKTKPNTIFQAPKDCPVEVTANFLWFHGSLKAQGTFYVATHDNVLMKQPSATSVKIKDLPVGTEDTVIGGPTSADGRMWWNLTVGPDTGWAVVDRWGFSYPKD